MPAKTLAGIAVHVLTASGAVLGLAALHHAAAHQWGSAFLWLGAAAVVDAIDGPLARRLEVDKTLPRFSGVTLDVAVDYFTYCAIPAFMILESGVAGARFGPFAAALIMLSSLFHFADRQSKTGDGFFVGFPAVWNVVSLYLFVFAPTPALANAVIVTLALATFAPVTWVHPVRVRRWWAPTLAVTALWSAAAVYEVVHDFPGTPAVRVVFALTAAYLVGLGLLRTFQGKAGGADRAE